MRNLWKIWADSQFALWSVWTEVFLKMGLWLPLLWVWKTKQTRGYECMGTGGFSSFFPPLIIEHIYTSVAKIIWVFWVKSGAQKPPGDASGEEEKAAGDRKTRPSQFSFGILLHCSFSIHGDRFSAGKFTDEIPSLSSLLLDINLCFLKMQPHALITHYIKKYSMELVHIVLKKNYLRNKTHFRISQPALCWSLT